MSGSGGSFKDEFNPPASDSKDGFDLLEDNFEGQGTGFSGSIVFRADQGVDDPEVQAAMEDLFDEVAELAERAPGRAAPTSEAGAPSRSRRTGRSPTPPSRCPTETSADEAEEIRDVIIEDTPDIDGLQVERGGIAFGEFENPSSEALGLAFAIVILILAFGSVLAMGLPVGVALFGIGIGTGIVTVLSFALPIPEFATFLGVMIGLGVGIDYALLIVTRYREQLHSGHDVRESITIAIDTAGRSVLFAGCTVVISLLSMMLIGVRFVQGLAVGSASVVAITVLASLTLLPALLGFAGERVELTRWRGLIAAGLIAVALLGVGLKIPPLGRAGVRRSPLIVLVLGLFVRPLQGEVAAPRAEAPRPDLRLPLEPGRPAPPVDRRHRGHRGAPRRWPSPCCRCGSGSPTRATSPTTPPPRRPTTSQAEGFGEGAAGPLLLVAALPDGTDPASLEVIEPAVRETPGVAFVSPAQPDDDESRRRALVRPARHRPAGRGHRRSWSTGCATTSCRRVEDASGIEINVTGSTAGSLDFSDYLQSRLPYFFVACWRCRSCC